MSGKIARVFAPLLVTLLPALLAGCPDAPALACHDSTDCRAADVCDPSHRCITPAHDVDGGVFQGEGEGEGSSSEGEGEGEGAASSEGEGEGEGEGCDDVDGDGDCAGTDCDDTDPRRAHGLPESCDGVDNDCNDVVDDDAVCGCDRAVVGGRVYLLCHDVGDAPLAFDNCALRGYTLAPFHTRQELIDVAAALPSTFGAWIGLRRVGPNDTPSDFVWDDDSSVLAYDGFTFGEPNNVDGQEGCVELDPQGTFNDLNCFANRPYYCALPNVPVVAQPCPAGARLFGGYRDNDSDGFTLPLPELECAATPNLAPTPSASFDCDDGDATKHDTCACDIGRLGGKRYAFCRTSFNFDDASNQCGQSGGNLAILKSRAEERFVMTQMLNLRLFDYWFGLVDLNQDGNFTWLDGSTPSYDDFAPNQPSNFIGENCCDVTRALRFDDDQCTIGGLPFVCELPGG